MFNNKPLLSGHNIDYTNLHISINLRTSIGREQNKCENFAFV